MRGLHKLFEVIITDNAHIAECSTCRFIYQTRPTNANEHYNTHDPVYSLHNTQES
jgi:Zn ribbon nucleic-acid-binding protein